MVNSKNRLEINQIDQFRAAARDLGAKPSEAEFDRALGQIGRANVPKNDVKPADRKKRKPLKVTAGKTWDK